MQRAVEVTDRALEEPELEELVRAAREAALDGAGDLAVLGGAGVDEIAPRFSAVCASASSCVAIAQRRR